jgi:hypothetical protein
MANYMTQAQKQSRTAEPCAKALAALLCVALLQTQWGYGAPYDSFVPMDGLSAVQQFLWHKGSSLIVPSVAFDVNYEWDKMLNTYPNATSGT